jgi:hypothetical protein
MRCGRSRSHLILIGLLCTLIGCAAGTGGTAQDSPDCKVVTNGDGSVREVICR